MKISRGLLLQSSICRSDLHALVLVTILACRSGIASISSQGMTPQCLGSIYNEPPLAMDTGDLGSA